jgi:hypothetical protein
LLPQREQPEPDAPISCSSRRARRRPSGQTETIKRAAQVMALLGGDLKAGLQMFAPAAQALVLAALVAEAHIAAQGRGWLRNVTITKLRTTAELHALATPNSLQISNMASPKL